MADTVALCYHAVSETFPANLSVRPATLCDQLEDLKARGYRGITFSEAVEEPGRGKRVAVTFDDAFASVLTIAKPILDDVGWPATIYAVSDYAAAGRPLGWDGVGHWAETEHAGELASLDWAQLRGLADEGWEIGSHTVTHPRLSRLADDEIDRELTASKEAVETALERPCPSVAYPYGDYDARVVAAARRAGYANAATLPARLPAPAPLEYPRVGVYRPDDMRRFRRKVSPLVRNARRVLGR